MSAQDGLSYVVDKFESLTPKFSIITAVMNDCNGLRRTAKSVLQQSCKDFEYIVIDGGSTDQTLNELEDLSQFAKCLSEPDLGISDAFNKGLNIAQGRWLNFLNAGDVFIGNNVLSTVENLINHDQKKHKVITGFAKFGNKTIPKRAFKNTEPIHIKAMLSHQASFLARSVFNEIGYFDLSLHIRMDYDMWLRVLKKYDFYLTPETWVEYDTAGISSDPKNLRKFYKEGKYVNKKNSIDSFRVINFLFEMEYLKAQAKACFTRLNNIAKS